MSQTKRILIVDDDADFAEALSVFLQAHGFRTASARDGAEGLKLARMDPPDLVILDIVMNERTEGFFTLQEMRRVPELRNVPVFVLSSLYSTQADFQIPPEAGWLAHDAFFAKPPDMAELLGRIQQHLTVKEAAT
jgi:DNA-binding response OmpR family regulator